MAGWLCAPNPIGGLFKPGLGREPDQIATPHSQLSISNLGNARRDQYADFAFTSISGANAKAIHSFGVETRAASVQINRSLQQAAAHIGVKGGPLDAETGSRLSTGQPMVHTDTPIY